MERFQEEDEQLKKDLTEYLQQLSPDCDLEDEISELRIPLRVYLRLHYLKGTSSQDSIQRVVLSLWLSKIAERIYRRHVTEAEESAQPHLYCTLAVESFGPGIHNDIWPDYLLI